MNNLVWLAWRSDVVPWNSVECKHHQQLAFGQSSPVPAYVCGIMMKLFQLKYINIDLLIFVLLLLFLLQRCLHRIPSLHFLSVDALTVGWPHSNV